MTGFKVLKDGLIVSLLRNPVMPSNILLFSVRTSCIPLWYQVWQPLQSIALFWAPAHLYQFFLNKNINKAWKPWCLRWGVIAFSSKWRCHDGNLMIFVSFQLSLFLSQALFSCFGLPNSFTLHIKPIHMLTSSVCSLQLTGTPWSGCFWRNCFTKECWGVDRRRYLLGSTDREMHLIEVWKREPFPMLASSRSSVHERRLSPAVPQKDLFVDVYFFFSFFITIAHFPPPKKEKNNRLKNNKQIQKEREQLINNKGPHLKASSLLPLTSHSKQSRSPAEKGIQKIGKY